MFVFESKLYLVVIDHYRECIEVSHLSAQTTRNVVVALRVMFSRVSIPSMVRSDNSGCFVSEEFRYFAKELGFTHKRSSPRYPQSNGLAG